jgi:hypothetical protein
MNFSPWFQVGTEGTPRRSGRYQFELWLQDGTVIHTYATFLFGDNKIVADDGRFIGLTYEDYWRGVMK